MIRRTKEYILENKMIKNHSTVLVALSGGADSVCLLLVLNEIKRQCANELDFALEAVHVEHGIRGAESRIRPIARIKPKMKSDRLLTTVSGSPAAKAVVDIAKIAVRLKTAAQ